MNSCNNYAQNYVTILIRDQNPWVTCPRFLEKVVRPGQAIFISGNRYVNQILIVHSHVCLTV